MPPSRRASRWQNARPANRLAGQKNASRNFFSRPSILRPALLPQVPETHQESVTYVFDFAPGCAVAPNKSPCDELRRREAITNKVIETTSDSLTANTGASRTDLWNAIENLNTYSGLGLGAVQTADLILQKLPVAPIEGRYGPITNGGARGSALPPSLKTIGFVGTTVGMGVDLANTLGHAGAGEYSQATQSGASFALGTMGLFIPGAAVASFGGTVMVAGIDYFGNRYVNNLDQQGRAAQNQTNLQTFQKAVAQYRDLQAQLQANGCN